MTAKIVSFNLNGKPVEVLVSPLTTLQTLLRYDLNFTATKSGCKQGSCGSCTVLVNGEPMLSCLLPVENIQNQEILTLEGLTSNGDLHPIQQTFYETFAVQCGFCTPGMIMVSKALLDRNPEPSRKEVVDAITGNYCRCTGYEPIIRAVQSSAQQMNKPENGE